jgi:hypothetical protein
MPRYAQAETGKQQGRTDAKLEKKGGEAIQRLTCGEEKEI